MATECPPLPAGEIQACVNAFDFRVFRLFSGFNRLIQDDTMIKTSPTPNVFTAALLALLLLVAATAKGE